MKNEELGDILFNFGDEFDLGSSPHIAGGSGGQGGCGGSGGCGGGGGCSGGSGGGGGSGGNALTNQTPLKDN
jgi:hypothetical protein